MNRRNFLPDVGYSAPRSPPGPGIRSAAPLRTGEQEVRLAHHHQSRALRHSNPARRRRPRWRTARRRGPAGRRSGRWRWRERWRRLPMCAHRDGRRHLRVGRRHDAADQSGRHRADRRDRQAHHGEECLGHRRALAADVHHRVQHARRHALRRHERCRHRALGHRRQEAGRPGLQAAGRPGHSGTDRACVFTPAPRGVEALHERARGIARRPRRRSPRARQRARPISSVARRSTVSCRHRPSTKPGR